MAYERLLAAMEIESAADAPHNSPMLEECRQLMIENERLRTALRAIAHMDVYTRPGEEPAAELMRSLAQKSLADGE
jgi:hypothetical protein